jgi:hypothetical protein
MLRGNGLLVTTCVLILGMFCLSACGVPADETSAMTASLPSTTTIPATTTVIEPSLSTSPSSTLTEETSTPSPSSEETFTPPPTTEEPVDEFAVWWEEYRLPFTLDSSDYPNFYRGAWGARLDELRSYLLHASQMRDDGFDSIMIEVEIILDRDTHLPRSLADDVFIFYIQALKREGFRVILIPNPMHPNLDQGLGYAWVEPDPDAYYHPSYEMIKEFDDVIIKWAGIAEEYGADAFLPVLEPYKLAGDYEVASRWLQEILPQIREVYHGQVWATDIMYDIGQGLSTPCPYDYSGYDFLISGPPAGRKNISEWEEVIRVFIQKGIEYVGDYSLKGFGLYEYGGYTGGIWYEDVQMEIFDQILSQEQAGLIAEALVRQATGKLKASFPRVSVGWEDFDTPSYEVIATWYQSMSENILPLESATWTYDELIEIEEKLGGDDYEFIFPLEERMG